MTDSTGSVSTTQELATYGRGSAFIDADTGTIYRMRAWRTDWKAEPFTGAKTLPDFNAHYVNGTSGSLSDIPLPVRVAWATERGHEDA